MKVPACGATEQSLIRAATAVLKSEVESLRNRYADGFALVEVDALKRLEKALQKAIKQ